MIYIVVKTRSTTAFENIVLHTAWKGGCLACVWPAFPTAWVRMGNFLGLCKHPNGVQAFW